MAQLFSKGTIKNEVQSIINLDISEKITIVQKLHAEWKNGNADDETRYEQNFNQLFFNELLGYSRNEHMHPKAGTPVGGKIADLGLGLFREGKYNFDDVQVAVELKGAKVFLDKKQNRQNPQSPVDQGFGYKTSFKNCKRLIVSNFHQIRLYRDNKQDYEERNIADLAKGDDNFFQLRKLLVLLSANRLLSSGSESHTEKLMTQFRIEQQKITKKFYQEYKGLRLELINDMKQRNPSLSVELLVEKAQKIIDRLVFVHFCEDKGLLPADKLKENIIRAHEADFTPWEVLKKYFKGVDSGSEKLQIPNGYNGELFKPDAVLDNLDIGDTICKKFIDLSNYDFDDELSVNILGHIFEQSISDLEQLKIDLLGTEVETDQLVENKKQSKRKKDGIFYTPEYIVDYIVQNSLMKYLSEKEDECLAKYKDEQKAYQAYQQILQNVKVLDPACGSGAFLVKVFDVLYAENQRVGTLIGSLFDESETYKNILTNNIYGVDLNPESVEITKLSLWLKSAQKGKKLNNLDKNIKCGNSLIDDPAVAGERAFDWHKEFKNIMDDGGFDVIVGNPPYVNIIQIDKNSLPYFQAKYYSAQYGRYDLYVLFLEKSLDLLNDKGMFSLIIPDKICYQKYGTNARRILLEQSLINEIVDCSNIKIFDQAVVDNIILSVTKGSNAGKTSLKVVKNSFDEFVENIIDQKVFLKFENCMWRVKITNKILKLIEKIEKNKVLLEDICYVSFGMQPGDLKKFVFNLVENPDRLKDRSYCHKKFVRGRNIKRYCLNYTNDILLYLPDELHRPAFPELFENEKIMISEISKMIESTIDKDSYYGNEKTVQVIQWKYLQTLEEKTLKGRGISLEEKNIENSNSLELSFLVSLLNSKLIDFYFKNVLSDGLNVYPDNIRNLPIQKIPLKEQQPFIEKADQMLALNKEFHEKKSSALVLLQAEYAIEKVSRKLENFWELDFSDFLKALSIKSLSLDKKEELMGWFGKKKEELASLKATIDQTDREIDGMVYELYGLSEEEIAVVEGR